MVARPPKSRIGNNFSLPTAKSFWRMLLESTSDDCKALVKELISSRAASIEESQHSDVLRSLNQRLAGLPALGLIGEGVQQDSPAAQLCDDALESVTNLQSRYAKLNDILSAHAKSIKTAVDDDYNNDLLGEVGSLAVQTSDSATSSFAADEESSIPAIDEIPSILDMDSPSDKKRI